MGWKSFGVVRFDLGPLLQGQTRMANLKVLITRLLLYPQRKAGILWIHHRLRPQRFLVSDLQSTFLSYLAGGLIWWRTRHPIFLVGFMSKLGLW